MTIRRTPEDFVVRERLGEPFRAGLRATAPTRGGHAVYLLEKVSLSTPEAVGYLARELRVRPGTIDYAGLKDKHARTTQHVSAPLGPTATPAREVSGANWSATLLGWSARGLSAEAIERNRFEIVVRDLSAAASEEMEWRAAALTIRDGGEATGRLLIVNYFGDQRFGSARHGEGWAAKRLVRGEFEEALRLSIGTPARKDTGKTRQLTRAVAGAWGDWKGLVARLPRMPERRALEVLAGGGGFREAYAALPHLTQTMHVEAYQSHLWNRVAVRLLEAEVASAAMLRSDDPFGEMVFPGPGAAGAHLRVLELPVLAPGTELTEPWGEAAAAVLAEEGLACEDLAIPGLRRPAFGRATRPLFVVAEGFTMGGAEPDELAGSRARVKRVLGFELPRGAYATVVLRGLGQ